MIGGIYCITINDMYYIGSAKNFDKRLDRHLKNLDSKTHHNIILQRSYDKYGRDYLLFDILEHVPYEKDVIVEKEQHYIDEYKRLYGSRCCNLSSATFGDTISNHPNRDKIIERRTETLRETHHKMGSNGRKIAYGRSGDSNGMFGKNHSGDVVKKLKERDVTEETRNKMSVSAKQKFIDKPELIESLSYFASTRTGDKNPFYGKTHSAETKEKMRAKKIGTKPTNMIKISIDNIVYESYNDASRKLDIPVVTIRYRCLSQNKKFDSYVLL